MRCDQCKFWHKGEYKHASTLKVSLCTKATQWWDASEWACPSGYDDKGIQLRRLKPEFEGTKMFVQDGSDYRASLYTAADFFCAHFESP